MERTIKILGKGKIAVKPDMIRFNIVSTGLCKEYEDTVKKSTEDIRILKESIEKAGLDSKSLKTVHFDINSEYENYSDKDNNYKRRFIGYKYTHNLYIQFPNDNELLGKVLYQFAHNSVNVEFSIRHTIKDGESIKNELLGKAIEDSKIKAETLTKAAGVSLGDILTIDYSWSEMEIYSEPVNKMLMSKSLATEDSYTIDIEADDIEVQDTVTIVWQIKGMSKMI